MSSQSNLPLVFLYTEGRDAIKGATRFQKLVFLAQEETDLGDIYTYHADKYGPFSPGLADDLEVLRRDGFIERDIVTNNVGNEKHVYSITPAGVRQVKDLLTEDNRSVFNMVADIKDEYNDTPLNRLLRIVYSKYESYTIATEFDLDRLFDPDTRSELLNEEQEFLGEGPDAFEELNPSAEEFFSTD